MAMASNTIPCEVIARDLNEITALQLDEEHHALYVLTNDDQLTQIDLNSSSNNAQVICQHKRTLQGKSMNDDDDCYSQGESDEDQTTRVSDPFEDSEPSSDEDEEKIENRRNWRRYGWRTYQLDNPCSILFLPEDNRLIVFNEGVITFLTADLENGRPFVQGSSKNIFCYDFDAFNHDTKKRSIHPWSIVPTSTVGVFIFSLVDDFQLYSLDTRNENTLIQKFATATSNYCPYLQCHRQSNKIFVYDSVQILSVSLDDGTSNKIDVPFIDEGKTISSMTIDKIGHVYILSDSTLFKCTWQTELHYVECLGKIDVSMTNPQMIVNRAGNEFYFFDTHTSFIYRWRKITA